MTCRELIEFLDDHLENRLTPAVLAAFEEHLRLCRGCRDYLSSYRRTVLLSRDAFRTPESEVAAMPEGLIRAVLEARSASN